MLSTFFGRAFAAWLVLALGLVFSLAAWFYADRLEERELRARFEQRTDLAQSVLGQTLRLNEDLLYGIRGFLAGPAPVTRQEFSRYVEQVGVLQRLPTIQAVAFVRYLPAREKTAFEAAQRREAGVAIHPAGERSDYFPVDYLASLPGNEDLAGLDLGADTLRREALEHARDSGQLTVATPPMGAAQNSARRRLLFVMPIYDSGQVPGDLAERRARFVGVAVVAYWLDELMHHILPKSLYGELDIEIFRERLDGSTRYRRGDLLWDDDSTEHTFPQRDADRASLGSERSLVLGGDRWWLMFFALPQFYKHSAESVPLMLLLSGSLLSLAIFFALRAQQERRRRAEGQAQRLAGDLERKEAQLSAITRSLDDAIWSLSLPERRVTYMSDAARQIYGFAPQDFYDDAASWLQVIHPADRDRLACALDQALAGHCGHQDLECRSLAADGRLRWLRIRFWVVWTADGSPLRVDGISSDLSTHKFAEEELRRVNRTLRMLSHCNEILVRASEEKALLAGICKATIEIGGYRLAWVGYAEHDAAKTVRPVAVAGSGDDYLDGAAIRWDDSPQGEGPTGRAIRSGEAVICRDLLRDPRFAPWREAARARGFAASIALPLKGARGVIGALNLYAGHADAFDADEVALLAELADDLAYGIVSLRAAEERRRFEEQLEFRNNYDPLTELANRRLLADHLRHALGAARRAGQALAVLHLDLDRFKAVNDSLGFETGDELLKAAAARLVACLRAEDTAARVGGDEFVVILAEVTAAEDAAHVARKLLAALAQPCLVGGREIVVTASVGISLYPKDGEEVETLFKHADSAMAHAKADGRNTFRFFAEEMNARAIGRLELESDLRRALERSELLLHYQPKVDLTSGEICGAEALVRWQHPRRGLVSPAEFIPLAEETGLIVPITDWVLAEACGQLKTWSERGLPALPLAVNLSPLHFRGDDPVASVRRALRNSGLDPAFLELELTEGMVVKNPEAAVATMRELKALGVRLAIDDFGTGYSSLSYLKRFPIDALKIDRSFVTDLTTDPDDAAITRAVIALAHSLKLKVIAEGVETEGQMNYLCHHRCHELQGYYFSRPLPAEAFAQLLQQRKRLTLPAAAAEETRTLLVVDDEPGVQSALQRALRNCGYQILTAASAHAGLDLLATHEVQVILSDQRMPEMSGVEFLSRVRELYPETIRMVLSEHTDLETVTEAVNRGAIYKFLSKPWDDDLLRQHLCEAFRHYDAERAKTGAIIRGLTKC